MAQPNDPNDRYSDHNLNPGEEEADRIFNQPDMQRLDRKMDRIEAHDSFRKRLDNEFDKLEQKRSEQIEKKRAEQAEQRAAEAAEHKSVENQTNPERQTWRQRLFAPGTKKRNMIFGGISGGIIGIFLAFFGFISPFKIPSVMQLVSDTAGQYVERITVKRAKVVMARAIFTKFGVEGGPVVTGDGIFSSLMATLRENRFEDKLKAKGLEIVKNSDGSVRLKKNGNFMPGNFKNPEAILKALESDTFTNKIINDLVKEEIPTWRWFKRAKFASWIRIKFDVKRFGMPKSEETDRDKKLEDMRKGYLTDAYDRTAENGIKFIDCIGDPEVCTGKKSEVTDMAQGNKSEKQEGVRTMVKDASTELIDEASKAAANTGEKFAGKLAAKIGTKSVAAIPVVGWIIAVVDLSADINHGARVALNAIDKGDPLGQVPAMMRGRAYAQLYADWAGFGDQIKNGDMDSDYHALLSTQLDGAEMSRALSCRTAAAESVASVFTGAVANAAASCDKGIPINNKINLNQPSALKQLYEDYSNELGFEAKYLFTAQPQSLVLEAYYQTLGGGGLSGWLGDKAFELIMAGFRGSIANIIIQALTPDSAKDAAKQWMAEITAKMFNSLLDFAGLSVDPLVDGPELANILDAGGIFSYREACIDMFKCHDISPSSAAKQAQEMAASRLQDDLNKGWWYAAFSPDSTNSLTSQLAIALPSSLAPQQLNVSRGVSDLASIVASTPARLMGLAMPNSSAHTYYDHYGVNPVGATDAELAQPLAPEMLDKESACPTIEVNTVLDICNTDKLTIESMLCSQPQYFDDAKCNFTSTLTGAGGQFRMATFNLLGAIHGQDPKARLDRAFKVMSDNEFHVVGLQEVDKLQFNEIVKNHTEYEIYPKFDEYRTHGGSRNAIIWRKDMFTLMPEESGTKPFKYFNGEDEEYPYVTLVTKEGQKFVMFNTHDPTSSPRAGNQSKWRVYDAKVHLKNMEEMHAKGVPTFMTGDFNSAFEIRHPEDNGLSRDELTYCILTSTGNIHNAYDVYNKKSGHCPTTKAKDSKGSKIDHIYLTTGIQVANWQKIDDPDVDFATDHPVVFADIIIPGSGSSADNSGETASAKGYVWPIAKADYKGLTNCYQKPGHTGIDFSAATGTKVRAAKDGKVVEVKTGVEGYSMSDAGGNYIIIQHNDGHWTNYQHNSKVLVTVGKDVKAGDVIALSGYTGYTRPAGKGGEHLHFSITTQKGLDSRNSVAYSINPTPFLPNDRNMGACGAP